MTATSGRFNGQGNARQVAKKSAGNNASLLPALIAGSACGLIAGPAAALQLGELEVQSALGQPLRASIAFALSPNEKLYDYCVALKPGTSADGLPMLSKATLSVANGRILLSGSVPLREPMLALQIAVQCNYTANLTRSYTIMLDPYRPVSAVSTRSVQSNTAIHSAVESRPDRVRAASAKVVADTAPIALSTRYTVKVGDTLSGIATRIENRPIALWPAVNAIFAANPDAFLNGDINRLKAGSQITIPSLDSVTAPVVDSRNVAQDTVAETAVAEIGPTDDYSAYVPGQAAEIEDAAADLVIPEFFDEPIPLAGTNEALLAEAQPGDVLIGDAASFVSPIGAPAEASTETSIDSLVEPDDSRQIESEAPLVAARPVPVIASTPSANSLRRTNDGWSWMFWLAGSGMALILGMLLFGRKIRARFDAVAKDSASDPEIQDDEETAQNEALSDLDIQVRNVQAEGQDFTLDADLGAGTGLNDNAEISVAQDFGFSTQTDLDIELPLATSLPAESNATDIMPAQRIDQSSILDAEVMPGDDHTYNMSMIVDATKQNIGNDVSTEKDLKAVPFDVDPTLADDIEFTMNDDVGLDALEQDYEDEFTATQAANLEIEKAVADLALRLGEPQEDKTAEMPVAEDSVDDKTAEMSEATDGAEITSEVTAQMPGAAHAENEEFSDLDDTGINEEMTAQLPASADDATAEMEVETGHYKTGKTSG